MGENTTAWTQKIREGFSSLPQNIMHALEENIEAHLNAPPAGNMVEMMAHTVKGHLLRASAITKGIRNSFKGRL